MIGPFGFAPKATVSARAFPIAQALVRRNHRVSLLLPPYDNLALDLILNKIHGRMVVLKNGRYDNMPIEVISGTSKVVDVKKHYNTDRLRPYYKSFEMKPLFLMTSEGE